MREKDFNTGLRGVLFEAKHYARMGAAIWLYGWLVLRQTHQSQGVGYVLGGAPVTYREIESETGFNRRTLEAWMRVLRREGYIQTHNLPAGISVRILKAKKHRPNRASTSRGELAGGVATRQSNLFRRFGDDAGFAHPAIRDRADTAREIADRGPQCDVANVTNSDESIRFTSPIGSSSVQRLRENYIGETYQRVEGQDREPQLNHQTSFGWENTSNREVRSKETTLLKEINPRNHNSSSATHPFRSDQPFRIETRSQSERQPATLSARYIQPQPETHQPQERFPWDLRKRMRLIRAEREDEVRRELYVGTGPEGRR
jgi:hypothetical protein